MKTDFLILGGGVAGLSAANHLAESGVEVTLLESGTYPSHKICGEFISPEALPLLKKWGIDTPIKMDRVKLVTSEVEWQMELPAPASSLSRYILDEALAKRAQKKGAVVQTKSLVEHIEFPKSFDDPYVVTLRSGEKWTSPVLLMSTGRLMHRVPPRYIGVKAHFEGIHAQELTMHITKGAYFGISPIADHCVNVAGLMACSSEEIKSPQKTFESFLKRPGLEVFQKTLASGTMIYEDWLTGIVPEFGVRPQPKWPRVYLMGDAAGVIAPATGNGLAMGLTSGVLAAECALRGQDELYRKSWNKAYKGRILRGMLLHRLFLSPQWVRIIPKLARFFPSLPAYCFSLTRGKC